MRGVAQGGDAGGVNRSQPSDCLAELTTMVLLMGLFEQLYEGRRMKTPLSQLAISFGLSLLLLSTAIARPVTTADLSGKTICWSSGLAKTFYPGGKSSETTYGEGTWRVTPAGVQMSTKYSTNIYDVQILDDGSLTSDADFGGRDYHGEGHFCKKPTSFAIAGPVTNADLAGKKICWDTPTHGGPSTSVYGPGNKVTSSDYGVGTWEVTASGVELHNEQWSAIADIQKLPDGTFTSDIAPAGVQIGSGLAYHATGKYCK
jgi:hypothetical protein